MGPKYPNFIQPAQKLFGSPKLPYDHTQYSQLSPTTTQKSRFQGQQTQFHHDTSYHSQYHNQYSQVDTSIPNQYVYSQQLPELDSKTSTTTTTTYTPTSTTTLHPPGEFPHDYKPGQRSHKLRERFLELQRLTSMTFAIADVGTCLMTLLLEVVMLYILIKFYTTKNIPSPGRDGPWHSQTNLVPTFLLAAAAFTTFTLAAVGLFLSRRRYSTRTRLIVKVVRTVLHIAAWVAIVALYRAAKVGNDLWGWSCSRRAESIQPYYRSSLDFDQMCTIQTAAWGISITEVCVKIILAVVGFYFQFQLMAVRREIVQDIGEVAFETWDRLDD